MRRAIWMALAFMGTAPLVALAQQNTGNAPAASPSGAANIEQGQDTAATQAPGAPGQQPAGTIGTQGQPATGGTAGTQGTPGQTGGVGGAGGADMGTGGSAAPTYRGTEENSSASPPADGSGSGGVSGQSAMQQAPMGSESMQRELAFLRQRVASLEAEVDALRGTGGGGTGGATPGVDTGTPGPDPEDMKIQGPVAVATAVFDGRVVDVARKHIDIVDTSDGTFYRLTVDDQTKAFVGPDLRRIPVGQISEGTPVRTSFALISGVEHARNIVTNPQRALQRQQQKGPEQRREAPPQRTPEQ
ncbi:hypothetical protein BO221_36195 [Archangium sp. Cb G35]|uniref:hypothetical protein n=1 Tax=Archangium sp. Cb G35 TaxID=1920190 RepID=UPI000936D8DD|nr:hypothetical protein [Archangium sp. Cb G35]OJT18967.1 hypothetical protein BO221_36195 [Archangium sp. Cb G35]